MDALSLSALLTSTHAEPPTPDVEQASRWRSERRQVLLARMAAILLGGDLLVAVSALVASFWVKFESGWLAFGVPDRHVLGDYQGQVAFGAVCLVALLHRFHLYRPDSLLAAAPARYQVFRASVAWLALYLGTSLVLKIQPPISRVYVLLGWLLAVIFLLTWRGLFGRYLRSRKWAALFRRNVLFVGFNPQARRVAEALERAPGRPYQVVGCCVEEGEETSPVPVLGTLRQVPAVLAAAAVDVVIVADERCPPTRLWELASLCEKRFVQVKVIPSHVQVLASALELETINGTALLGLSEIPLNRPGNRLLKRALDVVGSLVGLAASLPLLAGCALLIRRESPGPVLFRQVRLGRNGHPFTMYKLRTMRTDPGVPDHLRGATTPNDGRVLAVGRALRRWNLDELPQFWNVLRGEMSLVGPRPERAKYVSALGERIPHYHTRHHGKPGMTGWAQIHGLRGDTDLRERVRLDLYYLNHWSLLLDLFILLVTPFSRRNAY